MCSPLCAAFRPSRVNRILEVEMGMDLHFMARNAEFIAVGVVEHGMEPAPESNIDNKAHWQKNRDGDCRARPLQPPVVAKQDGPHDELVVEQAGIAAIEVGPSVGVLDIMRDQPARWLYRQVRGSGPHAGGIDRRLPDLGSVQTISSPNAWVSKEAFVPKSLLSHEMKSLDLIMVNDEQPISHYD